MCKISLDTLFIGILVGIIWHLLVFELHDLKICVALLVLVSLFIN